MKALAGFVACAAAAALAVGCDNHTAPIVDTTSTTSADFAARDAGSVNPTVVSAYDVPPLPAPMASALPVVQTSPVSDTNGGSSAPAAPLAAASAAPSAPPAAAVAPPSPVMNGAANANGSSANDFTESSFGSRSAPPPAPDYYVPDSPPSDNHGNGTLGSSTGSHEFDNNGDSK